VASAETGTLSLSHLHTACVGLPASVLRAHSNGSTLSPSLYWLYRFPQTIANLLRRSWFVGCQIERKHVYLPDAIVHKTPTSFESGDQ